MATGHSFVTVVKGQKTAALQRTCPKPHGALGSGVKTADHPAATSGYTYLLDTVMMILTGVRRRLFIPPVPVV